MKRVKWLSIVLAVVLVLGVSMAAMAANSDTITANYEVQAINEINIDDAAVTLTISAATAGVDPTDATDSTTYDITTNCAADAKKITGAIDTVMPSNVDLKINVTAPTGGSGAGSVTLTDTAQSVVTLIDAIAQADIAIGFTLSATATAGVVASASKTVTLTLTDS